MSDIPQAPDSMSEPHSHLKDHMAEVMAAVRIEATELLVKEFMVAFEKEGYRFDEFLDALAGYCYLQPGWGEVVWHLEAASSKMSELRRQSEGLPLKAHD